LADNIDPEEEPWVSRGMPQTATFSTRRSIDITGART
jgi:hypothetical protein